MKRWAKFCFVEMYAEGVEYTSLFYPSSTYNFHLIKKLLKQAAAQCYGIPSQQGRGDESP